MVVPILTHEVRIPIRATHNESQRLIGICTEVDQSPGPVVLNAAETKMFDPLGITLLAAAAALRQASGRKTDLILPTDRESRAFVEEISFDGFVRGQSPKPGTLAVRQMRALDAVFTDNVADILVRGVPGIDEDNVYPIQLCLNELLQNVFEWSGSPIGCTVLTRWYKKSRSVRLAVVDRGAGIPAALRRHQIQGLHRLNDRDVIVAAVTRPLLTSRANKVGGLGLKTIREVVCGRGGRLTIISLGAKVSWSEDRLSRLNSVPHRGTAIEIDIRPNAPFHPQDTVSVF